MIPLIIVAGPTASGKTALSIELAKILDGEIVSADSMQIYRGMDVGTAKPTKEEMGGIPHHMIDIADCTENFSVADYCTMATDVIKDVHKRGKSAIVVGGTGLYIDSLVRGVDFGENSQDTKLREELYTAAERYGAEKLHEMLRKIDPQTAEKYHPNNVKRVVRAIEFYKLTGRTISQQAELPKESPYKCVYFCIDWERDVLYERINKRVDIMMDNGLEEEVKTLLDVGCPRQSTAMQGIGYKEFFPYFDGNKSRDEVCEEIKMNSRRYAKRQLTWFRRNQEIHMLSPNGDIVKKALEIIKSEL